MDFQKENKNIGISIIIPNYNGEVLLSKCLSSIYKQIIDYIYEIIIIDNGSKDGSEQLIKNYYPKIKFIKLDKNYGFAKAVNHGIMESKGNYILLLNNDTVLGESFLKNMKKALDENPDVSYCASKILMIDNPDKIYGAGNIFINNGTAELRGYDKDKNLFNETEYVFGACAAASIYRRSLFTDIGYFDEDLFAYYEDVDLDIRAQLTGHKCLYVADAVIYHHGSVTSNKLNDFKTYYGCRNILLVMFKNIPYQFFLRNLINILFLQSCRILAFVLIGKIIPVFKGVVDAFKMYSLMKRKKEELYKMSLISYNEFEKLIVRYTLKNYIQKINLYFKKKFVKKN